MRQPRGAGAQVGLWCPCLHAPPTESTTRDPRRPVVELTLTSNRPVAMVAVRLSDVHPDDQATRVTYGLRTVTRTILTSTSATFRVHAQLDAS